MHLTVLLLPHDQVIIFPPSIGAGIKVQDDSAQLMRISADKILGFPVFVIIPTTHEGQDTITHVLTAEWQGFG